MRSTGGYQPPGGSNPGLAGRLSWWAINVEATQIADSSDTASQFLPGGVAAFPTKVGMTDWGIGNDGLGVGNDKGENRNDKWVSGFSIRLGMRRLGG